MGYKDAYIAALIREMEIRREDWRNDIFETIYVGGGTPSLLQKQDFELIFDGFFRLFSVSESPEITLEANPDDLSGSYVASLKELPFNRISIGVQSFDDRELRLLNRRHTALEALDAVARCKETAFSNISIDLIYGLPGQTMENWSRTLDKAIALDISHLSAYHLTYEDETPIYQMMKDGEINPVDEEKSEAFFHLLIEKLTTAGFVHYEISNFARCSSDYPYGRISLHNSAYWKGVHYLGLGASAHSYDGTSRSWNVSSLSDYITGLQKGRFSPHGEWLDERTRYNEYVLTRLRTMWGVSLNELRREFGKDLEQHFLKKIEPFIYRKKLKMQGDYVKVSYEGKFITDAIIVELIV